MSITDDRSQKFEAKIAHKLDIRKRARAMKAAGYSNVSIAHALGLNESTIRNYLKGE